MMEVISVLALLSVVAFASVRASAAPHRNRATMERSRRATNEENPIWGNPCDYAEGDGPSDLIIHLPTKNFAEVLAKTARFAYNKAYSYRKKMAELHSFPDFSAKLLDIWEAEDWLRKTSYGDGLPEEKVFNEKMPESYIDSVIANIDAKLPSMYMSLKMVVAGLFRFYKEGLSDTVASDDDLRENIILSMHDVRAVLCYCDDLMHARGLEIRPLLDKDLPHFTNDISFGLLLYRDTLNYMDYLRQVFSKLAEM